MYEPNKKKSKVAVIRCDTYEKEKVYEAVKKGVELLGGLDEFVNQGQKILLKPNVLFGQDPAKCISTHPSVFHAISLLLKEVGAELYYGDSSALGCLPGEMRRAMLKKVADELDIQNADFSKGKEILFNESPYMKKFVIAQGVLDCDGMINLPKMKTHGLLRITGAIKNLFGCIPGLLKVQLHAKLPNPHDFARMLVALNLLIKPRLHIMDGIYAMEGNGPRAGNPIPMNVILISKDPVALDSVFCRLISLNSIYIPSNIYGQEYGLGYYSEDKIEILGDEIKNLINPDFDVIRKPVQNISVENFSFVKNIITPKPVIDPDKCRICGLCIKMCPVESKAVNWKNGDNNRAPHYDYKKCIRCFCCQEFCPEAAIKVKRPLLSRIFS